jgi:hypothetical protein
VLYAADQPLALLCELALGQAAHDHAHPPDGIARSAEHLRGVLRALAAQLLQSPLHETCHLQGRHMIQQRAALNLQHISMHASIQQH